MAEKNNYYGSGIFVAGNIDIGAIGKPADSRVMVPNLEGLAELVANKRVYDGMIVYCESTKTYHKCSVEWDSSMNITASSWKQVEIQSLEELKALIAQESTAAMEFKGTIKDGNLPALEEGKNYDGNLYKIATNNVTIPAVLNAEEEVEVVAKPGDSIVCEGGKWYLIPSGDDIEDTWRAIKVNGVEKLGNGTTTNAVDFQQGNNVTITETGGVITIAAADTHYESKLVAANSATDATDETAEDGQVHLNLVENGEVKSSHKIVGGGGISVTHTVAEGEDGVNVITIEAAEGAKYDLAAKTENSEAILSLAGTDNTEDKVAIVGDDAVTVTVDGGKIKVAAHDTVTTVEAGVENGTIIIGTDGIEETIAIPGLDSMAYEKKEDYATSAENGAKALADQNKSDIQEINNVDTGILKQAKDYADGKFATQSEVNVLVEEIYGSTTTTGESRLDNLGGLVENLEGKTDALEFDVDYLLGNPTEGLVYELSDDGSYYICTGIGTVVPENIVIASDYNGLPVTSIGANAFEGYDGATRVKIPNSITSIGEQAFSDCTSLTSIDISDSVTSIGAGAFSNCVSLTEIIIPDSVTFIGTKVFEGCSSLQKIYYTGSEEDWSRIQFEEEWSEELLGKVVYNFANNFVAVNKVTSKIQNSLDNVVDRVDVLEGDVTVEGSVAKAVRDDIEVLYASLVNGVDSEGNDVVVGYADEANSATKATQDANGKVIHETYQTKTDDTLATTDKTVVGAINELEGKTFDKVVNILDTEKEIEIDPENGVREWANRNFMYGDEEEDILHTSGIVKIYPFVAGNNVTFEADQANQVVKINAVIPEETDYAVSIEEDTTDSTIAKRYIFKQLGEEIGRIDLAKELVVQSGSVGEVTEADKPYAGAKVGDKYIELVIANQDAPIYIPAKDLVDIYTAKADAAEVQVAISNTNEISATLVNNGITTEKIANDAITEDKIADAVNEKIAKGVTAEGWGNHANAGYAKTENLGDLAGKDKIADDDIADNAAIAVGKINGLGKLATKDAIVEGDIDGIIGIGKISGLGALAAKDTIADADIAEGAAIAHTKIAGLGTLATKDAISNTDIAANAAIEKTKLASDVQTSLGKADNALQQVAVGTGLTVTTKAENKQTINIDESIVFILDCNY